MPQLLLQRIQLRTVFFLCNRLVQINLIQLWNRFQRKYILQQGHCHCAVFQCGVNSADQRLHHLQLRPFSALRIDDIPWVRRRISIIQITVKHLEAFVIVPVLPAVLLTHTPAGILIRFQRINSLLLLLLADLEKELHHQISVIGQLALKPPDALNLFLVLLLLERPFQALLCHLIHPK